MHHDKTSGGFLLPTHKNSKAHFYAKQILHESIYGIFIEKLIKAYGQIRIGDPNKPGILCGPLHTPAAVEAFKNGIEQVKKQKGTILHGGAVIQGPGNFVEPTITSIPYDAPVVQNEIFVPVCIFLSGRNSLESKKDVELIWKIWL
jgi:acyl-CoA reductase-like NAD-dependent aldehyde dehydrogenase